MVPKAWIKAPLEAPTRKMKITKAADSCLQVDIKILRHVLLRVGLKEWRQWLLELYGKEVYRLG
jgi:hypothetical protein